MAEMQSARLKRAGVVRHLLEARKFIRVRLHISHKPQEGDLVFAFTSQIPNDFTVGFYVKYDYCKECNIIREIGSNRLCNYYNETFLSLNKELLGYEILEGVQYQIYRKVLKAFEKNLYNVALKEITFAENKCTVSARMRFKEDEIWNITFAYSKKTTIKEIRNLMLHQQEEYEGIKCKN